MRAHREVGVVGHGAYVPRLRIPTSMISEVWRPGRQGAAVVRKAVAAADEDVVTMAIEAARTAVLRSGVDPARIGAMWVGTESKPYAVKPSATIVAEALGITPYTVAADMEFACKAGSEAFQAATAFVGSGMVEYALAIGMDTAQSKPGDALEYTAGCGGAAFLLGPGDEAVAMIEASCSYVTDTPDFFRREGQHYPEHGARFTGEPAYFTHTEAASRTLLSNLGRSAGDYRHAVFHQPVPKFAERVAHQLGFTPAQIATGLVARDVGNAYAGSSLLGLAAVLDEAESNDGVFFCSYGSGAGSDAVSLKVTERLSERRSGPSVRDYIGRGRDVSGYGDYLKLRNKIQRS